jgi:hypothetical protein
MKLECAEPSNNRRPPRTGEPRQDPAKRKHAYGAARWREDMLASDLAPLEMAVGLGTHHDGMTGSSKQHVSDDYTLRLATATTLAEQVAAGQACCEWRACRAVGPDAPPHPPATQAAGSALATLVGLPAGATLAHCRLANESKCLHTAGLASRGRRCQFY